MTEWKTYILWFAQEHVGFRYAELRSLLRLWNIPFRLPSTHDTHSTEWQKPFCHIELPNDEYAKRLAARSVSIRCILELWSSATNYTDFHETLHHYIDVNRGDEEFEKLFGRQVTFRVTVETYNKHLTQKEKVDKIETIGYLPVQGDANLKCPDVEWYYIEFYGLDPSNVSAQPDNVLFGKWLADGNRSMIHEISLKRRKFIGNTSMDATLSLLMANQALVKSGDLAFDPFVGSGSLLLAAAKCGGYVLGADIDFLMLHGRTKPTRVTEKVRAQDECVLANLKQYGCADLFVDVLVSDFSRSMWHRSMQFDSIITDPPYGIREATERIETKNRRRVTKENAETPPHYPSTSHYNLAHLYGDLLKFSAKHLRMGGRLVCWIPIFRSDYSEKILPKHSCFELISNSEQEISAVTCRRLLTYEKIAEPCPNAVVEEIIDEMADFRIKFFESGEETRHERRMQRAELREIGRQEAIKRGKTLDENGKVINNLKK